jgi:hypothetical protein
MVLAPRKAGAANGVDATLVCDSTTGTMITIITITSRIVHNLHQGHEGLRFRIEEELRVRNTSPSGGNSNVLGTWHSSILAGIAMGLLDEFFAGHCANTMTLDSLLVVVIIIAIVIVSHAIPAFDCFLVEWHIGPIVLLF